MRVAAEQLELGLTARRGVIAYFAVSALVFLLMMLLGLLMRSSQGNFIPIPDEWIYRIMTVHGIGTVGIAGLAAAAVCWYFLSQYVRLSTGILFANLLIFLLGVVMLLVADLVLGFAGAWTFLYPLPGISAGGWGKGAAALHLLGILVVGVGFLLFYLDIARAILTKYGGIGAALGWPQLFGVSQEEPPPPAVVASTVVFIIDILAIAAGAVILVLMLVNLFVPEFAIDALFAKNMIYFFGHTFINATIYQAIIAVYEVLPKYTGRPWRSSKWFLGALAAIPVMVLIVYPHHVLMDFVMPDWMLIMGQIISWTSGLPVIVVTALTTLYYVYRSGIRWDTASGLLFLGVFGWTAGILPAMVDGTIQANSVLHNTLWVPGHFHFYLLVGLVPMVFGFGYHLLKSQGAFEDRPIDRLALYLFGIGGLGFAFSLLLAGRASVPRRFAVHLPEWVPFDQIGSAFAALVVLATLVFVARFLDRAFRGVSA